MICYFLLGVFVGVLLLRLMSFDVLGDAWRWFRERREARALARRLREYELDAWAEAHKNDAFPNEVAMWAEAYKHVHQWYWIGSGTKVHWRCSCGALSESSEPGRTP